MASLDLKLQLRNHVTSLFDEGMLNEQFRQLHILRESHSNNSGFRSKFIVTFFDSTEMLLVQADNILNENSVDFSKLYLTAYKIKGCSSMVGARNMKHAILPLIQCCRANDKEGCMEALNGFKHEYYNIRAKLEKVVQLEKIILHDDQN